MTDCYFGCFKKHVTSWQPLRINKKWKIKPGDWVQITMDLRDIEGAPESVSQTLCVMEKANNPLCIYLPRSWVLAIPYEKRIPYSIEVY